MTPHGTRPGRLKSFTVRAGAALVVAGVLIAIALVLSSLLTPVANSVRQTHVHPGKHPYLLGTTYLRVPTGKYTEPSVYIQGSRVVFTGLTWTSQVYMADLHHWKPRWLFQASTQLPDIGLWGLSAGWVAWIQYQSSSLWAIYARNLKSGRRYEIDSSAQEGPAPADFDFPYGSLSGNTLVWSVVNCPGSCAKPQQITSSIMVRHLSLGGTHRVASRRGLCQVDWPSIWGRVVVYETEGTCPGWGRSGSDVWLMHLADGRSTQVTRNHGSSEPVTNGRYMAWKQGPPGATRFGPGKIVLLDLKTGKRSAVSLGLRGTYLTDCWDGWHEIEQCEDQPVITSRILEWSGLEVGPILRDLKSGKEYVTNSTLPKRAIDAWGNRVMWVNRRSDNNNTNELATTAVP